MAVESPPLVTEVRRAPLSCERIISAAIAFIDANCLSDLSMRRLGGELGVEAMSLYRYFPSKAALLDAVVCRILDDVELPTGAEVDWEPAVVAYARSFRQVARRHPHLLPMLLTLGARNETLHEVDGRLVALLGRAGLDARSASRAQRVVQDFVTGSSVGDLTGELASQRDEEFGLGVLLAGLRTQLTPAS